LPNLDYKIMQGNSLLEEYEGIKLFDEGIVSASPLDNTKQIEEIKQRLSELQREFFKLHSAGELKGVKKQQIELELKKYNDWLNKLIKAPKVKADNSSLFDQFSQAKQKADELKKLHQEFFETANKREKDEIKKQIEALEWELIEATLREQNKLSLLPEIEQFKKANIKPFFLWKLNFSDVFEKDGGFDVVIGNPPYVSAVQGSKENGSFRDVYRQRYGYLRGAFDLYVVFLLRGLELGNQRSSYSWIIPNKFLVSQYAEGALEYLKSEGLYKVIGVSTINIFENANVYPILIFGNKGSVSFSIYDVKTLDDLREHMLQKRKEVNSYTYSIKDKGIRVASGTTGFQAKLIGKYISENKEEESIPFVVSGSINPYLINFNNIRYMNRTYSKAYIKKGKDIANSKWSFWLNPKIVVAGMTKRIEATYSDKPLALGVGLYALYVFGSFDPKFLLGLLNSKFFTFYLFNKFRDKHLTGGYLAINKSTIEALPLVDTPAHTQKEIVERVNNILSLNERPVLEDQEAQNKIGESERQIDQLVYKLYGLTPEEIAVVENKK